MKQAALVEMPLPSGHRTVVDLATWLDLHTLSWSLKGLYVGRNIYYRDENGDACWRTILMHRFILGLVEGDARRS